MDTYEEIIQQFIDFINKQCGVYMDSMAGFSGHNIKVKRQVARAMRPVKKEIGADGIPVIVHTSYEVQGEPDVVMHRTVRATDFLEANASNGDNEKQQARSILVFIYTFWEKEYRPRLAACKNIEVNEIRSDILGDIRILRNSILHEKGVVKKDKHKGLKKLSSLISENEELHLPYESMHKIFVLIKQDLARMLLGHLGADDGTVNPEKIVSVAIQKVRR
jgi:hypothetical protein